MAADSNLTPVAEMINTNPVEVLTHVVDSCTNACSCCVEPAKTVEKASRKKRITKLAAMYLTMVIVSSLAIYFLEHASIFSAVRTALVAAIGKTVAATWVSSLFN